MTGTTNLGLKKIDGTENWRNIFDYHNDSMDTLDQAVSSVENVEANFAVTIPVSGWVLVNGEYSYTWGNNTITSKTSVLVEFVENSDAVDVDYIEAEKITQGVKFTAPWIPNYPISVNIKITYAAETDISELTGDMVATDAITGAANVDEALAELDTNLSSLNDRMTPEVLDETIVGTFNGSTLYRRFFNTPAVNIPTGSDLKVITGLPTHNHLAMINVMFVLTGSSIAEPADAYLRFYVDNAGNGYARQNIGSSALAGVIRIEAYYTK